jgi:TetR/AcrR family transcriptional regulator, cholesterol catabolism regulator
MEEQDIRDKILEGTEMLFTKYGIRSVSMDDIARHLSVSKKTLYQHFADKDELVYRMSERYLARTSKNYEEIKNTSGNSVEELSRISVRMKQDFENMNPSLLFDLQKFHSRAWSLYNQHKSEVISQSVEQNIVQGIRDGLFRGDLNPNVLARLRIAMMESGFNEHVFPREQFNFIEVQTQIFELFVYGMCTDKGRKLYQQYIKNNNPQLTPINNETSL